MAKMVKNGRVILQKLRKILAKFLAKIFFWSDVPKYRNTGIPKYRNTPKKALENRQNVKNGQKRMISFAKVAENVFLNLWGKRFCER